MEILLYFSIRFGITHHTYIQRYFKFYVGKPITEE